MFEVLLWLTLGAVAISFLAAYDGSRDPFHPLIFIAPMLGFLYVWMPVQLTNSHSLAQYFDDSQLLFIQALYFLGTLAFVGGCCFAGFRLKRVKSSPPAALSRHTCQRLRVGSLLVGGVGLLCWGISIVNVGGFVNAFSKSYSGGWDDSGYVRDGNLLLLVGVLLAVCAIASEGPRIANLAIFTLFAFPWTSQALLMARRGPTFAIAVVVLMGWYLNKNRRPPMVAVLGMGVFLGLFSLFLVTNRSNIYLGSSMAVKTDLSSVTNIVDTADTGNEYIYGGGAVISSRYRDHYFWMRRYLAQILVRPIPSAIWATKYEDFGVPELLTNAGTGEGFGDALGWVGGSWFGTWCCSRSLDRTVVVMYSCISVDGLRIRLAVAQSCARRTSMEVSVRHCVGSLDVSGDADSRGGHFSLVTSLGSLLDRVELGTRGTRTEALHQDSHQSNFVWGRGVDRKCMDFSGERSAI